MFFFIPPPWKKGSALARGGKQSGCMCVKEEKGKRDEREIRESAKREREEGPISKRGRRHPLTHAGAETTRPPPRGMCSPLCVWRVGGGDARRGCGKNKPTKGSRGARGGKREKRASLKETQAGQIEMEPTQRPARVCVCCVCVSLRQSARAACAACGEGRKKAECFFTHTSAAARGAPTRAAARCRAGPASGAPSGRRRPQ